MVKYPTTIKLGFWFGKAEYCYFILRYDTRGHICLLTILQDDAHNRYVWYEKLLINPSNYFYCCR